ncbi:hypothetical protein D3C76_1859720 [compost metagenome]
METNRIASTLPEEKALTKVDGIIPMTKSTRLTLLALSVYLLNAEVSSVVGSTLKPSPG